jgi:hypothetical protein
MLSKPHYGWTEFCLSGTSTYQLSYLDDIAFDWIDQAIHGLSTMLPFCVKGFLEPNRFLCVVSYWNCHILVENDSAEALTEEDIHSEYSHTNMLDFCRLLHQDISDNMDDWVDFTDHHGKKDSCSERRAVLVDKLTTLEKLIKISESRFGPNRCFC